VTALLSPSLVPVFQAAFIGLLLALILIPLCKLIAVRTGVVAHPRNDRWHRTTVPLLGGVGIAVPVIAGSLVTGIASQLVVPLIAAFGVFVVGLVDDLLNLKPATKLIAQIALASLLVYFGFRLSWVESRLLNSILTIVWVVGLTNAFNLLDNMDGLCGGIAFVVTAMLLAGLLTGATRAEAGAQVTLLALLLGATGAFLLFNFPPASVFMGDSGALFLGFVLATLTLSPEGIRGSRTDVAAVIAGPVFVLLIPIFDTALVTANRLLSGRSPAVGGRDHSSHRLVAIGLSERAAVMVLWSLALVGGVVGLTLRNLTEGMSLLLAAAFVALMGLFAVFLTRVHAYEDPPPGTITPLVADFMFKRRVVEVVFDAGAIAVAYYGAYRLRFTDTGQYLANVDSFYETLPVMLSAQLIAFFIVGVYRGTWHYFNRRDGIRLLKGVVLGTAGAQLVLLYLYSTPTNSRGVFLIYLAVVLAITVVARVSFRGIVALARHERLMRRAVIYGAGEHAAIAVEELHHLRGGRIKVLGFVDDDPEAAEERIEGYAVLGGFETLQQIVAAAGTDAVILNREHIDDDRLSALESLCERHGVTLLRLHVGIEELVAHQGASPAARLRAQLRKARLP
jgi:UDP-GlcNAc:undecaprenyl-phosphate GlcNAc-1-phosphate transferase